MCDHEYYYDNYVIECHLCGSTWTVGDFIELASRVPSLEKDLEEWKVRAADLSHTISEMKIGIDGLFTLLRECLPYVRDMIGISSSARILESEITELLGGMKCTYFLCNNIAVFAGFCEDHKHRYFATEDD